MGFGTSSSNFGEVFVPIYEVKLKSWTTDVRKINIFTRYAETVVSMDSS